MRRPDQPYTLRDMSTLTIELPSQRAQTDFNLRRWTDVLADRMLAKIEGRIETDRHGQIIMSPPPGVRHSGYQAKIAILLSQRMAGGQTLTECPISTADGVRAADVVWVSDGALRDLGEGTCFRRAPELCVEVLSPDNTKAEMREKMALYFDAGAGEVWLCGLDGKMTFFVAGDPLPQPRSSRCPEFPVVVPTW